MKSFWKLRIKNTILDGIMDQLGSVEVIKNSLYIGFYYKGTQEKNLPEPRYHITVFLCILTSSIRVRGQNWPIGSVSVKLTSKL